MLLLNLLLFKVFSSVSVKRPTLILSEQKMPVDLELLQTVLKSMDTEGSLQKPGQLEDTYWSVMKLFGVLWVSLFKSVLIMYVYA